MSLPQIQCKYITEECLREWKNGNPSFRVPDPVPMLRFLYELCSITVRGELPFQKCKAAVDSVEFVEKPSHRVVASTFADIVTQMAQDLTMPGEHRVRLIKLAKWLVESALVPLRLFQERCEEEFLWEAEMIKIKAQDLKGKEVTLLCHTYENATESASAATIGIIKSLIGHFDLDPNRVFDIVLECYELQPNNKVFLELIPIFPKSHASHILGFKFQYYQRMEVNSPVPFSLYKLTALLVKEEFIDLDSIYTHLLPKDDEAFEHYNAFSAKRLDEANKIGKINLAATGKDLMEDEKQGDVTIDLFAALDLENEAVAERSPELENSQTLGLLTGFLSVDDWYHAHILFERLAPLNPVAHIQICDGLLRLIENSISSAYDIVRQTHLQSFGSFSGAGIDAMDTADLTVHRSFIDLPKELFEMLATLGPYLYRDTVLLQKVCRVLRGYYFSALELVNCGDGAPNPEPLMDRNRVPRQHLKEARLRVEEALGACLLPSLQLIPANPAVGQEIWEVMNLLPYEVRYRLYGEWEKDDERNPMVLAARQTSKLDTRRILKRLAKENLKQLGRMVAKLAHANPMTVLRTIVHQIEAYRDMITPVVDAFKYLTQLEYDVLEYVVIERLAQGGRDKLKDDGLNLSDWLQSLASFWGHLCASSDQFEFFGLPIGRCSQCKKYPSMELRGLFQYLVNQLKRGKGIELVLLQELIQQMANVQYTENLTEDQLDAMAGSETLRYQATSFGVTRNNKALIKSTNRLKDSLLPRDEPKLAIPLLLLIAQHRSVVVINADAPYIKMVCEEFDRCHGTLLQYVEFLCSAVTPATAYAQLIPSLNDLVHQYHLDPEVAFLIFRPVMRLFKCQGSSAVFWPLDDGEAANNTTINSESEPSEDIGNVILDLGSQKPVMWSDLLDTVKTMLPSKAWNSLSPDLYTTFWGLTLYDLYVPRDRYESEIAKQHAALKALEELSDNSSSAITKRKKDKERIQESLDRLTNELHKHEENVASVRRRLSREKDRWLSSCPDTLKINMEFLQRCIFPRCTFSMPDAVYCAMFVHTLHSLGTPFFNTVNHIDVLICKTLQPMICCCTEYEAGRLGKFLFETLKIAYHWKSDESIYERECGNMPGFAVYYRYPNSQRVTYGQFIKVHWKWSQRITRLLIQCLESAEYMEIRNALILLTKISGVFPVTRKSGINLEKRVAKIKNDEREDLKVLATGVAAALANRKSFWVTDEEFGMGYLELKPAPSLASKSLSGNVVAVQGSAINVSQSEPGTGNSVKDHISRAKPGDGRLERTESISHVKSDNVKLKGSSLTNGSDIHSSVPSTAVQAEMSRVVENQKQVDEDENMAKVAMKNSAESESKASVKRSVPSASLTKAPKQDLAKDDNKSAKAVGRTSGSSANDRDFSSHAAEGKQGGATTVSSAAAVTANLVSAKGSSSSSRASDMHGNESKTDGGVAKSSEVRLSTGKSDGNEVSDAPKSSSSRAMHSPRHDSSVATSKSGDRLQKRTSPSEDPDRPSKRYKGDTELRDSDGEVRVPDRERSADPRFADLDKIGTDEQSMYRTTDRSKDKGNERYERDHRERLDRLDKSRVDDIIPEKQRDRSMERYGRERSVERGQERGADRAFDRLADKAKDDRNKDDRSKLRYNDSSSEKSHVDERFHGQSLPPPPPLPPHIVPQSVNAGRRDEDADKRFGSTRHSQRLSPRHDEKERRRSEENSLVSQDDAKRRREDDFRDRKREDREGLSLKMDERERERDRDRDREKANLLKEEMDANAAASKRRKLKREHLPSGEAGEYSPVAPPYPPLAIGISQSYDGRDRGDRKGATMQRTGYMEEQSMRIHGKEVATKMARRDSELYP
ncbi:THO complex subunit 2 [Citrus sinensis]|nr:THO complex subunit 2 [Citrus sinensis]